MTTAMDNFAQLLFLLSWKKMQRLNNTGIQNRTAVSFPRAVVHLTAHLTLNVLSCVQISQKPLLLKEIDSFVGNTHCSYKIWHVV